MTNILMKAALARSSYRFVCAAGAGLLDKCLARRGKNQTSEHYADGDRAALPQHGG